MAFEKEDTNYRKQKSAETTYTAGIIASQVIQLYQESAKRLTQLLQTIFLF